jgi:carbon storage regulator
MLVLTRRIGQEVLINGNYRIKVVKICGRAAHLGITAPEDVRIDRYEVHQRRAGLPAGAWGAKSVNA